MRKDAKDASVNAFHALSWCLCLVSVVLIAAGCRKHAVASSSMAPTIMRGEEVTVDYTAYKVSAPARWDVIVFVHPWVTNTLWAMRVVALSGETVSSSATGIEVNGKPLLRPPGITNVNYQSLVQLRHSGGVPSPFVVPKDSYFVLGDNSTNANDSRYWGAVPPTNIRGRVLNK
ncbi:MAG: signal peptidase I [Limisphaerales bacterium]